MFKQLTIKMKLRILVLIPLLLIGVLGIKVNITNLNKMQELKKLEKAVELSTLFGSLIDDLQKERGYTASYIASNGKRFTEEISNQRLLLDKRKSEINNFFRNFEKENYNENFLKQLDLAIKKLDEIDMHRANFDKLIFPEEVPLIYFSKLDNMILTTIGEISKLSSDAQISQKLNSYLSLMLAKEDAGFERAIASSSFSKNKLDIPGQQLFMGTIHKQKSYLNVYNKISDDDAVKFFNKTFVGKDLKEVKRLSKLLMSKNKDYGVETSHWIKVSTSKIEKLKKIEDFLANRLLKTIKTDISEATTSLFVLGVPIIIGFCLVLFLSYFITKDIIKNINRLKLGIDGFFKFINHEQKDCDLIETDTQCELGEMSKSVNENIIKTKQNARINNKMIEETIRIVEEVKKGHLDVSITTTSNNPTLNKQKEIINEMFSSLFKNISRIMKVLNSYSNFDYRPKIDTSGLEGELKELISDVNILRDSITQTLMQNKKEGLILQKKSNKLSQMMANLSSGVNNQAASLEETAASIEEITSNITNNTNTTMQMANYGNQVKNSVSSGNELANKTVKSMDEIYEQSITITEAIEVIDKIAFQTNILSLNAAVEAATAGESGKGFAVVAQEVRNLAARSAEAAKQIKEIVEIAQNKAREGKKIASDMITGYQELNTNITNTIDLIEDVNSLSKEQQLGISQINDAVNGLDKETQENALRASSANDIAKETNQISNLIIQSADSKEFEGKN